MPLEKKNFIGGLNSDSEDRLVVNGDYRYALNVRASKSDGANEGSIENTKGNLLVDFDLPNGENKVLGAFDDILGNKVVYCVWNSYGSHSILEFDGSNNNISVLIQDSILNFQKDKPIVDPTIIGDNFFFNDRFNEPRSINLVRAREGGYPSPLEESYLRVIVNAPGHPANVRFGSNSEVKTNNVRGKLFQVRYKWVYLDNEESAWSPISKVALPIDETQYRPIGYYPLTLNNYLVVNYALGGDYVKRVKIAIREGNTGDFFLAEDVDKSNIDVSSGFANYEFYNDEAYTSVDNDGNSGMRLFDNVPQLSDSMSQIDGNKIAFGGITENYDPVEIDMDVQVNTPTSPSVPAPSTSQPLRDQGYNDYGIIRDNFRYPSGSPFGTRIFNGVGYSFMAGQKQGQRTPSGIDSTPFFLLPGTQVPTSLYPQLESPDTLAWVDSYLYDNGFTVGSTANPRDRALYFKNQSNGYVVRAGGSIINEMIIEPPEGEGVRYVISIDLRYYDVGYGDNLKIKNFKVQYVSKDGDTSFDVVQGLKAELVNLGIANENLVDIRFDHSQALNSGAWYYGFGGGNVSAPNALLRIYGEAYIPQSDSDNNGGDWPQATGGDTGVLSYMNCEIQTYASWTLRSEKTLKSGATHGVGLVYMDDPNRSGLTNLSQEKKFYVPFFSEDERGLTSGLNPNDATVTLTIKHTPPAWAKRYQVVYTGNQTVDYLPGNAGYKGFIQCIINDVNDSTTIGAKTATLTALDTYNESTPEDIELQYSFSKGDRIRFITEPINSTDAAATYLNEYRDVEVISYDDTAKMLTFKDPGISVLNHQLVEVYTPKTKVSDVIYREIGECYDIVDGFHQGDTDQTATNDAVIELKDIGDVYLRYRTTPINAIVEDYAYSDYYDSDVWDKGRPNKVDNNIKRVKRPSTIRYSENFVPETNINGLSQFNDFAFEEYDQQYGTIERLYSENKDLLVLQQLKIGKVRIGQTTLYGNDGSSISTLKAQDKVLSDVVYYSGEFGIGTNPESFAVYGNRKYFTDANRGAILRLSGDGLTPISDISMHNYFTDTFKEVVNNGNSLEIIGEYDIRFGEYIVSIQSRDSEGQLVFADTLAFSEIKKRWCSFYSYIPECLVSNNVNLISFKDGKLYRHNENDLRGNFYESQFPMQLRFLSNVEPSLIKVYNAISTESSGKFSMPKAVNQYGQETSLILEDFVDDEGVYKSNFLKDVNTPNVSSPLIEGDDIRCHSLDITLENNDTEEVKIFAAGVNVTPSQLTNR